MRRTEDVPIPVPAIDIPYEQRESIRFLRDDLVVATVAGVLLYEFSQNPEQYDHSYSDIWYRRRMVSGTVDHSVRSLIADHTIPSRTKQREGYSVGESALILGRMRQLTEDAFGPNRRGNNAHKSLLAAGITDPTIINHAGRVLSYFVFGEDPDNQFAEEEMAMIDEVRGNRNYSVLPSR
ncbi:hypothetical protein HY468_05710 [Candidatus Roizmanbacteria bacterium]|nr:hypothetical protein [Candidatus Roizmanbacteria bacterium]